MPVTNCWRVATLLPIVWHQFDNDYVVYFQDTGGTHQLDGKAAYILKLLEDGIQTESEIIAHIEGDKKVRWHEFNRDKITEYVRHTLNQFVISQLIN